MGRDGAPVTVPGRPVSESDFTSLPSVQPPPDESDARREGRDSRDSELLSTSTAYSVPSPARSPSSSGVCSGPKTTFPKQGVQPREQGAEVRRFSTTETLAADTSLAALAAAVRVRADRNDGPAVPRPSPGPLGLRPMGQVGPLDPSSLSRRRCSVPVNFHLQRTAAPVACVRWTPPSHWARSAGPAGDDAAWVSSSDPQMARIGRQFSEPHPLRNGHVMARAGGGIKARLGRAGRWYVAT